MKPKYYRDEKTYHIIKKFGADIGDMILSYLFMCDICKEFSTEGEWDCELCSPGMIMCKNCYDLRSFDCAMITVGTAYPICIDCGLIHCRKYSHWTTIDFSNLP